MIFSIQLEVLIITILSYLLWALWHHRRDKSLTYAIFIEYLLTASLVLVLLMGVLS